jgi:large subunit ribosomal protein L2
MSTIKTSARTPGQRFATRLPLYTVTKGEPYKQLVKINPKNSGRNNSGRVTVRHQGGRHKRLLREIDWKRLKRDMQAKVLTIEYDPNRTANVALLQYEDGTRSYILASLGMKVDDLVLAGEAAEIRPGNSLPLGKIPVGAVVHNVELSPGRGAQLARGAGTGIIIQGREDDYILIKLPSGEIRRVSYECYATVGQISNPDWKLVKFGKAGRKRRMGIRPTVRGVAQHPGSHPHGGGEGRSGIGMPAPKSPWGKRTLGVKTRKRKKYSDKMIVKDRRIKRK